MNARSERLACLTMDMEPDLHDPQLRIRLLDDDDRLSAFGTFLREHDVPLTCFVLLSQARRYFDRLNVLARMANVEFAAHSYSHDTANPASESEVRRSWDTFGELWNAPPLGYRSPNCLIDERGLAMLAKQGFQYDSSVVPAIRPDKFGYNNLKYGREPFYFGAEAGGMLELPVGCHRGIRLPFILSYVKLLGLETYEAAMKAFPLPNALVTYFHPYDLYVGDVADQLTGWKRLAHLRNASRANAILAALIYSLKAQGYRFVLMSELATSAAASLGNDHPLTIQRAHP